MITLPIGVKKANGRPFGLGIMQSAWQEPQLIKYGSAIEDLLSYKCKPQYYEYVAKNIPVI
nr:BBF_HP1_G0016660.mRNA.1.CDS.1 [Saccharomyces cerevisiae]